MDKNHMIVLKIQGYAQEAMVFLGELSFEQFVQDRKTIAACVLNLSQIGELAAQLDSEFIQRHSQIPWHKMRGMRNRIVHDYEGLQVNIIWDVMVLFLPDLLEQIELLKNI